MSTRLGPQNRDGSAPDRDREVFARLSLSEDLGTVISEISLRQSSHGRIVAGLLHKTKRLPYPTNHRIITLASPK